METFFLLNFYLSKLNIELMKGTISQNKDTKTQPLNFHGLPTERDTQKRSPDILFAAAEGNLKHHSHHFNTIFLSNKQQQGGIDHGDELTCPTGRDYT